MTVEVTLTILVFVITEFVLGALSASAYEQRRAPD